MLACPQQCSTFLCRHEGILSLVERRLPIPERQILRHQVRHWGQAHPGGRRADVYKFWYMWRAKGTKGFEKHVDAIFAHSEHFTSLVNSREGFELVSEPECTNICFWYIPKKLRNLPRDESFNEQLHKVAPAIKEKMMKEGSMMITYQPLKTKPNFFRLVLQDSSLNKDDMLHFIDIIERYGEEL